ECSVTGDMFFQSFDGRIYTFPATCQYVLAKSRNSGKFTVTIQNAPCGANLDGACIQSVNLMVDEDPRTEITMSHSGEVFLASQFRISLPYSDDVFQIQELSSMFVQVKSSQGLRLQYNWREFRLYLQLEEQWRDDTVGLCGTFNGNIQDDFLAPSGMIESTPYLFGNAWRVSSACVPRPSLPQLDPCDTHQQAAAYAVEKCDVLTQEVFSACHEYVSPVGFQLQCRADVCRCGAPCLCSILAHYTRTCRRHGVIIEFRSHLPECAITCPSSMEYGVCVSSCQRRCLFLSLPQPCGEECEEGCVCPEGTYFNMHTHTCVPRSECPCSFLGANYSPGDVILTSSGVQICQDGKLVSQSSMIDTLCPPGQFYEDCGNQIDGHTANKGLACEQTCESYLLNLTCSTHEPCVPGCICPAGSLDAMMTVTAENVDCFESGVICRKSLLISLGRSFIVFDDDTGKPVDVTWFYMNCLVDTCGCNRGGDCECFCTSVAAYAHRCCLKGVTIDWRSPSVCPYDCEYYNKALGKGPLKLLTYRERGTLLAANKTSGLVFPKRELTSTDEILTLFMMTPGISKARPHDTSLVSFEAADRPNYFLKAERSGQLRLQKWEEAEAFWDAATFVLHRDTWISGFDSLESLAKPGFFLHFMLSRLQLMKYSHSDRYRRATLFKLTGGIPHYPMGPRCQWRYESCVSPCFRTCSDPSGLSCASILK
ncbi:hypothetical protein cypCar_00015008, partial [Cyprinus carpio]